VATRDGEDWFRVAFAHAAVGLAMTDAQGRFLEANPAFHRITGYDEDELLGIDFLALTHPDDRAEDGERLRGMLDGREPGFVREKRYVHRAGGTVWVKSSVSLVRDAEARPTRVIALVEDITDRRQAEATIAEQVRLAQFGRDVGRALTRGGTMAEVLDLCVEATVRHLDGAFARIWTLDEAGETLELRASAGMYTHVDGPHARVPVGRFKIGMIAQERKPHLTNAVIGDPQVPAQDWARAEGMVAFAGYPLVVEDRLVGVLAMFARHVLSDAALRMMGSVADEIALGIERKRSEERLHRQREWLRVTLASIGDAVIATDVDGNVTFLNAVAEELTGWPQREAEGKPLAEVFQIINELTRAEVESPVIRALREGRAVGLANHTILIARDGSERSIDDSAAPIRDEAGSIMGAVLIFRDIVERRKAERALEASEARKASILESSLDAIITINHEGRVIEWNPAAERTFGFERAAALGREMCELIIPPSLREAHRRGLAHYLRTGEGPVLGRRFETTAIRAGDGEEFPVELAINPIETAGSPLFTAHVRDITEAKRAEQALREREHRFHSLAESIPQLAWMARPDGHLYWYNRRWYEYTGTTPEQMEGWGWQAVHDPKTLPTVIEGWKKSLATGEPFDMVFPLRAGDGSFRPFLTRIMPVKGEDGRIVQWFGTNTDISDQLRIEEELRAAKEEAESANRAKTQFLAVLSHELRTPLNPILLAASSMLERPADPEELRPTLEMIRQNVLLQARLIDDLLDVMRIVRGKMPLHWEVADCHKLIGQAVQICRSEILGHVLRLEIHAEARRRHVNADPARLQQVFWNLIRNAIKFTPEGGAVTIRTRDIDDPSHPEGLVVVEVSDTGIGIEPAVLPLIFDPFQQGETTITRKFGGLGLGLAICKGIVDAHGGTIAAESQGKGQGTTFRVILKALPDPAAEEEGRPPRNQPESDPAPPSSLRILAVEDEPTTLRLMARLLRRLGHEAASTYANGTFDLIISDIGLPDGTGLDLMRRAVALRGPIPAIALTGYGMEEDIRRSREAGFTAHLTKPIDFTKLESMIRQVAT
jgi:PAS domain S-box-containing protein